MDLKSKALSILLRDEVSNIDMAEALRRGTMEPVYASNGTVLLIAPGGFLSFFVTDDENDAREALLENSSLRVCVAHGELARDMLKNVLGLSYDTACRQYAWMSKEKPSLDPRFTFRVLTPEDAEYVSANYNTGFEDIPKALSEGRFFGAEMGGRLVGFIGLHSEGSVGMLQVDPEYRRMGIGLALENYMFAKHIEEGRVAYGQVFVTNEASLALQKRAGISVGSSLLWWMFRESGELEYREFGSELIGSVKHLYSRCGWTAYLGDDEKLKKAFDNSLFTLGAFEGDRLVGFIRCVGDGEHVVLVQDLLVRSRSRRNGIGTALMKAATERFCGVRMFFLVTDENDEPANAFYRSLGMQPISRGGMVSYFRY
ncbi:MAG: GNAT family N-acetyltransferase [Clostridia bacterium]|nr:GNAT family N-acetyltransferase [Clostridia bacterium]